MAGKSPLGSHISMISHSHVHLYGISQLATCDLHSGTLTWLWTLAIDNEFSYQQKGGFPVSYVSHYQRVPDCRMISMLVGGLEHFPFFHILGIIIPVDFHIFQRGSSTTNQYAILGGARYVQAPNWASTGTPGVRQHVSQQGFKTQQHPLRAHRSGGTARQVISVGNRW